MTKQNNRQNAVIEHPKLIPSETDIVYVLGHGSHWNNNEIRFSLRSVMKYLTGWRNIYIIGENPGFLEGESIHIILHPDEIGPKNADGNIIRKVIRACQIPELSENFIFMNDDNYFLRPISVDQLYVFHKGNLDNIDPIAFDSFWGRRLGRTRYHLTDKGFTPLHFDHHSPFIFNKYLFPQTVAWFDYASDIGLTVKSIYGAVHYPDAVQLTTEEATFWSPLDLKTISKITENAHFMAHNDRGLNDSMKYFLWLKFSESSPYEITPPVDKILDIASWERDGREYNEGVRLFSKYSNQKNLIALYQKNKSSLLHKKLNYYFTKTLKSL